jgi:putative thioredoxin
MLLDENNVQDLLVKNSATKAVFVYFFVNAPECQAATAAVKANVPESNDYVALVEADVSSEVGQAIAMQLGLRSVPTLVVLKNSQPVDALQGDDIVSKITDTVAKYMPSKADNLMREALEAEAQNKLAEAIIKANEAYSEAPTRLDLKFMLARLCIKTKDLTRAHELLDNAGREEQNEQEYKDLISSLTLAESAADSPQIRDLQKAHEEHPEDLEIVNKLAIALSEGGRHEEALNLLFEVLKHDLSQNEIKKTFLDILNTLNGNALQKTFRRKLYTLMY